MQRNPRFAALWLLAAGFVVLAAIGAATVWLVRANEEYGRWAAHSRDVQFRAATLLLSIRAAETGQRSFLLTRQAEYLAPVEEARRSIGPAFEELLALTADNPVQQAHLASAATLIRDRLQIMDETIARGRAGDWEAALERVRSNVGTNLTKDIVATVERMQAEEAGLLVERNDDFARAGRWLLAVTLSGVALIVALAAASAAILRRWSRELEQAQTELREANEGLEEAVQERTAELLEANEEVQRFAYVVSHDLRAPLVNIMGFTSELEAMRADIVAAAKAARAPEAAAGAAAIEADFDEAIGFIKASSAKMDRLINAILKLSREGRRVFAPQRIDMRGLLEGVAATLRHQTEAAGAEIVVRAAPEVVSDRLALEQIFANLLENAVKYLEEGRPGRIEVRGRERGRTVAFEVEDNGRGVEERDRERIFDLFRRAGRQDRPGEGIGLAHVRTLVRRLGGRIVCRSTPGQGTTFTVELPRTWRESGRRSAA